MIMSLKPMNCSLDFFAGDYSTFAIGTTLNTGTNIGPGCNIVTSGFPPRKIKTIYLVSKW